MKKIILILSVLAFSVVFGQQAFACVLGINGYEGDSYDECVSFGQESWLLSQCYSCYDDDCAASSQQDWTSRCDVYWSSCSNGMFPEAYGPQYGINGGCICKNNQCCVDNYGESYFDPSYLTTNLDVYQDPWVLIPTEEDPCRPNEGAVWNGSEFVIEEEEVVEHTVVSVIQEINGEVEIQRGGTGEYVTAQVGDEVYMGDFVSTGYESTCTIRFSDIAVMTIRPMTQFGISQFYLQGDVAETAVSLRFGEIVSSYKIKTGVRAKFEIETPTSTAAVRGTIFSVAYDDDSGMTEVVTYEGEVDVTSNMTSDSAVVGANQKVYVDAYGNTGAVETISADDYLTSEEEFDMWDFQGGMPSGDCSFTDTCSHQYSAAIDFVKGEGIVEGYSDGTYKPDNTINRAEFIKIMIASSFFDADIVGSYCFSDVNNEWFARYICLAKAEGIINGYPDGTFKPAQMINLAEALKIIWEGTGLDFSDPSDPWYQKYFDASNALGILATINIDPAHFLTRGEMAEIVYQIVLSAE